MALFQVSVLKKYLKLQDEKIIDKAYKKFTSYFQHPEIQENIRKSKEEQFQATFLSELFVNILGYKLNPNPNYYLTKDEFEWMELFEEKKKKALELQQQIEETDRKIDRMVYELYGLNNEEIAIVEAS